MERRMAGSYQQKNVVVSAAVYHQDGGVHRVPRAMSWGDADTVVSGIQLSLSAVEGKPMNEWSPLEEDVFLKGLLTVVVRRRDGRPLSDRRVMIRGCGFT